MPGGRSPQGRALAAAVAAAALTTAAAAPAESPPAATAAPEATAQSIAEPAAQPTAEPAAEPTAAATAGTTVEGPAQTVQPAATTTPAGTATPAPEPTGATDTSGPTPAPSPSGPATPTPTAIATPTGTASPTTSPTTTPTATATSTQTASPTPTATDATDLVPTTELGGITIGAPALIRPTGGAEGEPVVIIVEGIAITDSRTTPGPFTATASASGLTTEGVVVPIPGLVWRTTSVVGPDGIPATGVGGGEGDLLDTVVIATGGGTAGEEPRTYVVSGTITVPVAGLPAGDYAFTLSTSIS
jgi:hypothetical protein